jgi:hypothetical protein
MMFMSLPKVQFRPITNMAWYGTPCHNRPVDQFKLYSMSRKCMRSNHHYDLMLVRFNVLAKCWVLENFKSKSY